jgi:PhnB protein
MSRINVYLAFNGDCREAMTFYKNCLGGELQLQSVGESPMSGNMPANMSQHILHSTLNRGDLLIMASDMAPKGGLVKGNSVSLLLDCESEEEIRNCYSKLSSGGSPDHPLENTFWGALFGDLTDRFGNRWLLNFLKPSTP